MKPILVFTSVLTMAAATGSAFAEGRELQSVRDSSELVALLDQLSDAASDGASLEFFGWKETFRKGNTRDCRVVSASVVVADFLEMTKEILYGGQSMSEKALSDFANVIGSGEYSRCYDYQCANRSCSRVTSYYSLESSYKIQFELAYED